MEVDHLCILAWGGKSGQNCWPWYSCSPPRSLAPGKPAQSGAARGAEVAEQLWGLWGRRMGAAKPAQPQKGRNLSHLLWTWEKRMDRWIYQNTTAVADVLRHWAFPEGWFTICALWLTTAEVFFTEHAICLTLLRNSVFLDGVQNDHNTMGFVTPWSLCQLWERLST